MVVDIDDHRLSGRNALHRIGEDASEPLDIVPARFHVWVVRRPKYACRACENGMVQTAPPVPLIEGGMPTEGDRGAGLLTALKAAARPDHPRDKARRRPAPG